MGDTVFYLKWPCKKTIADAQSSMCFNSVKTLLHDQVKNTSQIPRRFLYSIQDVLFPHLEIASGLEVVATASSPNHAFVKFLRASFVFDYKSISAVGQLL